MELFKFHCLYQEMYCYIVILWVCVCSHPDPAEDSAGLTSRAAAAAASALAAAAAAAPDTDSATEKTALLLFRIHTLVHPPPGQEQAEACLSSPAPGIIGTSPAATTYWSGR